MNQKVYDALKKAGRPEAACLKAAHAADRKPAMMKPMSEKKPWREQIDAIE